MAKQTYNNIRLGIFVIAGLVLLVIMLYMVGKKQSLFTRSIPLKVRFRNVEGLMPGNNVRFSGIQSGTVKKVAIVDDTTIEVTILVEEDVKDNIRKNAIVYIGSEGLMGNKVVNIIPGKTPAPAVEANDILPARPQMDLNDALGTLYQTNDNVSIISSEFLQTIRNINNSQALWRLLNDSTLQPELHATLAHLKASSAQIHASADLLTSVMTDVREGKGVAGMLLQNRDAERKATAMIDHLNAASLKAERLVERVDSIAAVLQIGVNDKGGLVHVLLQDTVLAGQLSRSLDHIESGTAAFDEDMKALQHNILLRGYFRKQEKKNRKQQ